MGHHSQSIVLEVFKSISPPTHHFHLVVEAFRGSIALVTAPHHDDGFQPRGECFSEPPQRRMAQLLNELEQYGQLLFSVFFSQIFEQQ